MLILLSVVVVVQFLCIIAVVARKSSAANPDGTMVVTETDKKKTFSLEIDTDPDAMSRKTTLLFRVVNRSE